MWTHDRKMENSMSTSSDESKNGGKVFMCITRLDNFCINEGNISINNIEGSEREFMHSNVDESGILASSLLQKINVQDLVNCGLERPAFDKTTYKIHLILIHYFR